MAIIRFHTKNNTDHGFNTKTINHSGTVMGWLVDNIQQGESFKVYEDSICLSNEISRDLERVKNAQNVDIFITPSADPLTVAVIVSAVLSVASLVLSLSALPNVTRTDESPNNALSDRKNVARPNERIVDICGKVKSIPDVIQQEFSFFEGDVEVRVGYYCVGRNQIQIKDIKDGDSFKRNIVDSAAGVYYPNKSPNNSDPDDQVGDFINEEVKGVFQSSDATGQTISAPNADALTLNEDVRANSDGYLEDLTGEILFTDNFEAGDEVVLTNLYAEQAYDGTGYYVQIGLTTSTVISVTDERITFDITDDDSWALIDGGEGDLVEVDGSMVISNADIVLVGPFDITSVKVDELVVNVYAANGMYKEKTSGRSRRTVEYNIIYQKLDDNGDEIGVETSVSCEISGNDSGEKGETTRIDLGAVTYVRWSVQRITELNYDFNGTIVDEIKVKSLFGRWDLGVEDFGNVTTIQTKRTNASAATAIKSPELNCIATEMIYEYLGDGEFSTELTPNTKAMQSLIRLALDEYVGRRTIDELDADLLLEVQEENESYFDSESSGQFSYSFDSTSLSAEQIFSTIATAAFTTLWREGRVLKAWFESPQSLPNMVFTHRSKQPGSETWSRNRKASEKKDSVEFIYTDDDDYTQETLYYPTDRSGTNPDRIEIPGVKGVDQATWHMMRAYNKSLYQEISVEFGATQEGRFVRPKQLISVVKGSRTDTYDGYISSIDGLYYTLSQEVSFTDGDTHYLLLKNRDGSTESVEVTSTDSPMVIELLQIPSETPYTGNDALKTEFSFGNEARLSGQLMIPESITPTDNEYVSIKAVNYSDLYYQDDPTQPIGSGFDSGFDSGFN